MWHEARKQERLIRGMIVDYRRRAERRKDFYEKIKAEPTQFLQFHGRECKIHLDPAVAAAGEGPAIMMPWQGDKKNMIDRFDVRAHLDFIPEVKTPDIPPEELSQEERHCNYERYRILAQNAFLGISEDKFLQQLAIEEQFGVTVEEKEMQKVKLSDKKGTGAAIGYNYNDPGAQPSSYNGPEIKNKEVEAKDSDDESDLDMIDVDLSIDVNKMEASQAHELNAVGPQFGMAGCDLFSFMTGDADDAEHQKQLLREEKEKAMFSGRKSRRERRAHRDKKLATRVVSPPSYAAPSSFPVASRSPAASRSPTRSPSPDHSAIQFITSFGPDDEERPPPPPKPLYADKLKQNLRKPDMLYSEAVRKPRPRSKSIDLIRPQIGPRGPNSVSRSRSRSRSRSKSKSRSYSRSRSRSRSRSSRSRSKSFARYRRTRSRSRSRSRPRNYRRRSRSISNHASGYANRNRSRSISYESNEKSTKKAVPRYYGRRKEDKSSSELSLDSNSSESDEEKNKSAVGNKSNPNQNQLRLSGSSAKGPSREMLSMKEKLKRKMQAQLSKQLRADKRAEAERLERESRKQARRDEEMRELALKMRRKQREMRHFYRSSDEDSDRSRSGSSSRQSPVSEKKRDARSRSNSRPPPAKPIPVWEVDEQRSTPPYTPKAPEFGLNPYLHKKSIPDVSEVYSRDTRFEERDQNSQHMPEKYPNKGFGDAFKQEGYERTNKFDQDRHQAPNVRRQITQRGGLRNQNTSNAEQNYEISRHRDFEHSYGDGPPNRYRESKNYGDGPSGRYRDTEQNYGDGPSGRYRDSQQNYGDGASGRYRDCEPNYGDGPSGRYRDSGQYYGDGPSGRYRNPGPNFGEGSSNRYRHEQDGESNNYRNKVKLVDY